MAHWLDNRVFGFVDLGLAAAAILVWLVAPQVGWLALPIALLPWAAYLLAGRAPWRFTPFDIPLLIFLVTAAVGVWASYTPPDARQAWWLLVGSALLFYALLRQPPANLRALAPVFAVFAVGAGKIFDLVATGETGGPLVRLTQGQGTNNYPACSPDGRLVAFFSTRAGAEGLYVMRLTGGRAKRISTLMGDSLRWDRLPPSHAVEKK